MIRYPWRIHFTYQGKYMHQKARCARDAQKSTLDDESVIRTYPLCHVVINYNLPYSEKNNQLEYLCHHSIFAE